MARVDEPRCGHVNMLGRLGHLLVAIAEPHPERVHEYNQWFEEEHMYDAVMVGPGAFAANRYVATRRHKLLRHPDDGGVFADSSQGSYVGLYYLAPGTAEEHFAWSFPQNAWLGDSGRNNRDRMLVLTWLCDFDQVVHTGSVAPQIALDHPYRGLVMAWIECPPDGDPRQMSTWFAQTYLPDFTRTQPTIDQVQLWSPREFPDTRNVPTTPGTVVKNRGVGRHVLVLFFLNEDPATVWSGGFGSMGEELQRSGMASLRLVAPFIPTVRGTQTYVDELW